ncbi:hypothetical protein GCM10010156_35100 [Planobispora rosea]|uniref:Uncharacterized protein n=1 Tax=Planobispora rosea TaxID=35762 RepID=A0A8J3S0M7_PLARO|nr:hypothetical protein GCM10010156_35100 [Planobispora rosea]GIH85372.1 hypothetical protein Pro02_37800 [Planobispora rosea]
MPETHFTGGRAVGNYTEHPRPEAAPAFLPPARAAPELVYDEQTTRWFRQDVRGGDAPEGLDRSSEASHKNGNNSEKDCVPSRLMPEMSKKSEPTLHGVNGKPGTRNRKAGAAVPGTGFSRTRTPA